MNVPIKQGHLVTTNIDFSFRQATSKQLDGTNIEVIPRYELFVMAVLPTDAVKYGLAPSFGLIQPLQVPSDGWIPGPRSEDPQLYPSANGLVGFVEEARMLQAGHKTFFAPQQRKRNSAWDDACLLRYDPVLCGDSMW